MNLGKNIHNLYGAFIGPWKMNVKCGALLNYKTSNQDSSVHTLTHTHIQQDGIFCLPEPGTAPAADVQGTLALAHGQTYLSPHAVS